MEHLFKLTIHAEAKKVKQKLIMFAPPKPRNILLCTGIEPNAAPEFQGRPRTGTVPQRKESKPAWEGHKERNVGRNAQI